MDIVVSFPGGKRVDAHVGPFHIATDQPVEDGGSGSAPTPYTLFLASLATCAGIYVVGYCNARNLPLDGISVVQSSEKDEKGKTVAIRIDVRVPPSFPERYRDGVAHAAGACKVKKTIADPPAFEVLTVVEPAAREESPHV